MPNPRNIDPFDLNTLKTCKGYIPEFIDGKTAIDLDVLNLNQKKLLPKVEGDETGLLKYTNLSVWYNERRKTPFLSAYNVDGNSKQIVDRASSFKADPRISKAIQLGKVEFYDKITEFTEFEIGHMASHNEMAWGSPADAKIRSFQTFHFPNSVPQVEKLNSGLWSKLESYVIKETADTGSKKINVFTGPMLQDSDPEYNAVPTFQVPLYFFKLIVFDFNGELYSTAFVMSQFKRATELGLITIAKIPKEFYKNALTTPFRDYNYKEVFQVNIEMVEKHSGLNFHWPMVSRINVPGNDNKLEEIKITGGTKKNSILKGDSSVPSKVTNIILPGKKFI